MRPITVLLADDHAVVREGLRALLESEGDIEIVGQAKTGREAVSLARELVPAVVVMDIAMPLLNGLEATRRILRAAPATQVIILSAHSDPEYVERAIALGAAGFILKQSSARELAAAIREAGLGSRFRPSGRSGADPRRIGAAGLTSREMELLQLIAEGKANKVAAAELGISIKTVEKHRHNLSRKLDIHDTAGLTRYAIATGIIESGGRFRLD